MEYIYYVNGEYVNPKNAHLSINDLGVTRGIGIFEFLCVYNRVPFALDLHLKRLYNALSELDMGACPVDLPTVVQTLIDQAPTDDMSIRIYITGGLEDGPISVCVCCDPVLSFPEEHYSKGVAVMTTRHKRAFSHLKTTFYLPAYLALQKAKKQNCDDALYVNEQGHLLELTKSNFFAIIKGSLVTPKDEVLPGTTRDVVLQCIDALGLSVELRPISYEEISTFTGAFQTSSSKEIMPISQIDGVNILLDPLVNTLRTALKRHIQEATRRYICAHKV